MTLQSPPAALFARFERGSLREWPALQAARPALKTVLFAFGAAIGIVLVALVARTASFEPTKAPIEPVAEVAISAGAAERLAGSLRFPTISAEDPSAFDGEAFDALHDYLKASFPRVHAELDREIVQSHSLLYTWRGSDASLKPILLIGHLDVVPVEPGTEDKWQEAPFGGRIVDGFIWGRGAIDNKSTVVGALEAVELLLREGFRPSRTVYLAFGHDEEVGGTSGARGIAALLSNRRVELEMVLDEGGVIGDGIRLTPADLERMHGSNERIAVRTYERAIRFYRQLILDVTGD